MQVSFTDRESWRGWLDTNGQSTREVWLVFYKKHTGKPGVSYEAALEEALCVGWIDSLVKRLDEDRYVRKFTPRTNAEKWSDANVQRVRKLMASGRMTEAGLAQFHPGEKGGAGPANKVLDLPDFFREALAHDTRAQEAFDHLAPLYLTGTSGCASVLKIIRSKSTAAGRPSR